MDAECEIDEDSDETENENHGLKFYFWNNWSPPKKRLACVEDRGTRVSNAEERHLPRPSVKIGTWIAPDQFAFGRTLNVDGKPLVRGTNQKKDEQSDVQDENLMLLSNSFKWNADWGERCRNIAASEGLVWNLFSPGLFGTLKLTINSYGNITAYADAEYVSPGCETILITINKEIHLRKMLAISNHEWLAFTEALKTHKENVSYDALRAGDWQRLKPLQQMWYMICKRRHLLPSVCFRMREAGVQKITQFLKILPKFVVEDVRTCDGKPIA